ncbi:hypothetical protein FA13DRAFT_1718596 [Coprinellus micaceus]|uniref:Uncharacterized protein n=1 Tax=Coprinellus micaceus TaxID=71717 RepID=A0A4Y7SDQ2_COPMI|nr:hypothetical protein FA13DRAFT_1718596 [Coprinellus micaceus]
MASPHRPHSGTLMCETRVFSSCTNVLVRLNAERLWVLGTTTTNCARPETSASKGFRRRTSSWCVAGSATLHVNLSQHALSRRNHGWDRSVTRYSASLNYVPPAYPFDDITDLSSLPNDAKDTVTNLRMFESQEEAEEYLAKPAQALDDLLEDLRIVQGLHTRRFLQSEQVIGIGRFLYHWRTIAKGGKYLAIASVIPQKERGMTTHHFPIPSFPIPRSLIFDSHAPFRQDAEERG